VAEEELKLRNQEKPRRMKSLWLSLQIVSIASGATASSENGSKLVAQMPVMVLVQRQEEGQYELSVSFYSRVRLFPSIF